MSKSIQSTGLFAFLAVGTMLVFAGTRAQARLADFQCDGSNDNLCKIKDVGIGSGVVKPTAPAEN